MPPRGAPDATRGSTELKSEGFDCLRCGACCVLPDENRREEVWAWVEVDTDAPLLKRQHVVARHVVRDEAGKLHLRLDDRGRCSALRGRLGQSVRCDIYEVRPRGCRRVEAGD